MLARRLIISLANLGTVLALCAAPAIAQTAAPLPAGGEVNEMVPFRLSPAEQEQLDRILVAWEHRSGQVKTLRSKFTLLEYDAAFAPAQPGQPLKHSRAATGEINYVAPDKGSYRIDEEGGEQWMCDGQAIYEFRHSEQKLIEHRLPKELQGKAISDSPLPFIFGAEAAKMRQRYFMRVVTPPGVTDQIWLEALPRFRQDAANYYKVEVILRASDLLPIALQIFATNYRAEPGRPDSSQSRTVYAFQNPSINSPLAWFQNLFDRPTTPRGYQREIEEPPPQSAQAQPAPGGNPPRVGQAPPAGPPMPPARGGVRR